MTTPVSIDSIGWYLLSVSSDKLIDQAKEEWGLTNGTIHSIIYELNNPPIANGQSLSSSNWNAIDTTLDNIVLYANIGYWVYVSQVPESESQPEPQPEPSPEPSPEPDTPQGTVQDGYISGATVTLRNMDDTLIANYTTDTNGSFTGTGAESYSGNLVKISVTGGTDISTNTAYSNTLQYIGTLSSLGSIVVNPLSTLVVDNTLAEASANGTDVTETLFNSNKETIRDNLGLTDSDMDGDFINNENATVALIVNKIELIKDSFASGFTSATTDTVSQSIASAIKNKGGSFNFNSTTDIESIGSTVNSAYGDGDETAKATRIKDYLVAANTELDTTAGDETLFLNKFTNVVKMRKGVSSSLPDFTDAGLTMVDEVTNRIADLSSILIYDVFVGLKAIQVSFISDVSSTSDGENSPFILVWLKRNSGQTLADEINDVNDVLTLADDTYKDDLVNTDDTTEGEFFLTNYNEQVQANIEASMTGVGLDVTSSGNISLFVARKSSSVGTIKSLRYTMQEVTDDGVTSDVLMLADTSADTSSNDILTELNGNSEWYNDTNEGFLLLRNPSKAISTTPSYTPAVAATNENGEPMTEEEALMSQSSNAVAATGNYSSSGSGSSGVWGDILSWFAANI